MRPSPRPAYAYAHPSHASPGATYAYTLPLTRIDRQPHISEPIVPTTSAATVYFFFFACSFFNEPSFLRAAASQPARLPFAFLRHAFNAAASFCALVRAFFFAQPVTVTGVDSLIFNPFCARNSVGMTSLLVHKFPFAANAEYLPCGNTKSNVLNGTS